MTIYVINPNSTAAMTDSAVDAARAAAPDAVIIGWTSTAGPPAIQGPEDGARAIPPLLELVRKASDAGATGIVIACADDTGLAEARRIATCPVLGIGQAGYVTAALLADRFAVVTTLAVSIPILDGNVRAQGLGGQLTEVIASGVPVLALENISDADFARLTAALHRAEAGGASAAVLGCSGMAPLLDRLSAETGMRLIDGVAAAVRLLRALPAAPGRAA